MDLGVTIGRRLLPALAALLAAVAGPAAAQGDAAAGRFIAVTGEVKVLGRDGVTRSAERNGEFRQGDSIVTGPNSLAQLRMSDGGAVSVRAETQLKLDGYRYTGAEDRESSFAVSILKGGFRMITGLIARNNRQNYRVSTSSMTLGVRGTHFEVVHVLQAVSDAAPGTYNRVYDGSIAVQNRTGASIVVNPGQTVFVALPSNRPPVLIAPPVGVFGKPTPAPQPIPQARGDDGKAESVKPAAPTVRATTPQTVAPARVQGAPLLNPIDTPRALEVSPALQTAPALTPIDRAGTVSPTLVSPAPATTSPALSAPATSTIAPAAISPTTTTVSPVLTAPATISPTLSAPATSTISPAVISPTTTTVSPILTAPAATSPVLTAPTTIHTAPMTTIQTPPPTTIQTPPATIQVPAATFKK